MRFICDMKPTERNKVEYIYLKKKQQTRTKRERQGRERKREEKCDLIALIERAQLRTWVAWFLFFLSSHGHTSRSARAGPNPGQCWKRDDQMSPNLLKLSNSLFSPPWNDAKPEQLIGTGTGHLFDDKILQRPPSSSFFSLFLSLCFCTTPSQLVVFIITSQKYFARERVRPWTASPNLLSKYRSP